MRKWLASLLEEFENSAGYEKSNNEHLRQALGDAHADHTLAAQASELLRKMVASPSSEPVWRALERRSNPDAKTSAQLAFERGAEMAKRFEHDGGTAAQANHSLGQWCFAVEEDRMKGEVRYPDGGLRSRHVEDMARELIYVAVEIESSPIEVFTSGKRRERVEEAARAIEALREALAPLWSGNYFDGRIKRQQRPRAKALDGFAVRSVDQWLDVLATYRMVRVDAESVAIAYFAAKHLSREPFAYLDALIEDAREWASEPPELARPNDPNAARLMFIRRLTAYFRAEYGHPLRACVLTVAGHLFDCGTLDASAIAKLAP